MTERDRFGGFGVCFALLAGALICACSAYDVQTRDHLSRLERQSYPTLILAAPQLYMNHAAYQSYQYGMDLAELLSVEGRIPVLTAWELDIEREQDGDVASDVLMALIDEAGISVTDVLLCELRIDEAMTTRTVQAPLQMGGGTEHQYQSDVTVTLTLRTATYREEVAQVSTWFEDPPFPEDATAANPRPVLREGILEAGRALIEQFEETFPEPPDGAPPEVTLQYNPRDQFAFREVGHPPLETAFEDMDELDRLASRMVYFQYFEPEIGGGTLRRFETSEPGLLVVAAQDGETALRVDDYIVGVEGQRVAGVHTFWRAFLLARPGTDVRLTLERGGERRVVRVPVCNVSNGCDPAR